MKIDKDALLKHHFWILVAVSIPLAAIAILLEVTSVSSSIEKQRKDLLGQLALVKGAKDVRAPQQIADKKFEADTLLKKETEAWKNAFLTQESLFSWPREVEANYHFSDGLFASEVQVLQKAPPAEKNDWPEHKPGEQIHGKLLPTPSDAGFKILAYDDKDRKQLKEFAFLITPGLIANGITVKEEGAPQPQQQFQQLREHVGKFVAVTYQKAKYFNDRLTDSERIDFSKTYHGQIPAILRQVDPVRVDKDEDGNSVLAGVVQFKSPEAWMFDPEGFRHFDQIPAEKKKDLLPPDGSKFLRFKYDNWNTQNDFSDEAWIAQEDLWIQNEIYRLIRTANDSIGRFQKVGGAAKDAKTGPVQFKNPYFELTLKLRDAKTLEVKIANLLDRRQKVDPMKLRVHFLDGAKDEPEIISISGDPLEPRGTAGKDRRDVVVNLKAGPRRTGIFGVEQVLTWETAAVKRIDHIAIGSLVPDDTSFSQRTMPMGLQPYVKVVKAEEPADAGKAGIPGGPAGGPPGGFMPGRPGGFKPGGGGDAPINVLPNGFSPDRYQEVTPQFRRVPVAIALIVDQNHVDRVQNAFNNSKLRFLMTQVLLNHYPQSLKPQMPGDAATDGVPGEGTRPIGPMFPPRSSAPMGPRFPGAPAFPMAPGIPAGPAFGGLQPTEAAGSTDDTEANMELVLYGVVTLYERYPARPAAAAAATPVEAKAP